MAAKQKRPPGEPFIVVAIDFGTTYSGYGYSFTSDYIKEPGKIVCAQWFSGSKDLISMKTPTVLLLKWHKDRKDFSSEGFGYEAENKYLDLVDDENHADYYLVRRFKMGLYEQTAATGLGRNLEIELGTTVVRSIKTIRVFSMCIAYLKTHFLESIENKGANVKDEDIKWVLTVPAIWTDGAKQFMREAAVMAGIETERLAIALEPEAASLYCLLLPNRDSEAEDQDDRFSEGTNYMVIDCGGGTIDICVHEVVGSRTVVEKHVASGGNWGGTVVDEKFLQIWVDIVGHQVFRLFEDKHRDDLTEMYREFEFKKGSFSSDQQKLSLRLPLSLCSLYKKIKGEEFDSALSKSKHAGKISISWDKLKIDISLINNCFDEPVCKTVEHVKGVLEEKECKDVNTIVLVGGFAKSNILQDALRKKLPSLKVIVPEDPQLAVVKGAVVFGHNPLKIQARFAKYTYGLKACAQSHNLLLSGQIPIPAMMSFIEPDSFDIHVTKGQRLNVGEPQKAQHYFPIHADQMLIEMPFFMSTDTKPELVTDASCSHIGTIRLELSEGIVGLDRPIAVTMTFGDTEIGICAVELRTGKETKASLNCLV